LCYLFARFGVIRDAVGRIDTGRIAPKKAQKRGCDLRRITRAKLRVIARQTSKISVFHRSGRWRPSRVLAIEAQIEKLKPDIRRVSSGRSGLTERLTDLLSAKTLFKDVLYMEGRHTNSQTPAQYLGAWRSVNDLQVQLGPELFQKFLSFVTERTAGLAAIETTYLTRAWAARRA
jgi:hypothetical protein